MIYYKNYEEHEYTTTGKRKKYDTTIYTFDIETTSYIKHNNEIYPAIHYDRLTKKEQTASIKGSNMYIWMLGVNDIIYYGRTWDELKEFLRTLDNYIPYKKMFYIHNLAFEFQYLKSVFAFEKVVARKKRKVMKCELKDYNIEMRCTYFMSNVGLRKLPDIYNLPVKKLDGDLDYNKLRHSLTPLTPKEMEYCEHDCLIIYYYIKRQLENYDELKRIPLTSTGFVRGELKEKVRGNIAYKNEVSASCNKNPHIYNLLCEAFAGGYTHANWVKANKIIKNVDSYDFTSSYPYCMVVEKYPSTEFKKCIIRSVNELDDDFAYLLVVKYKNLKSKLYNNFISKSRARSIKGARYDNGRIIEAEELTITLTDVDFKLYFDCYDFEYEILEAYYSLYKYLPKDFYNFILDKYVIKTEYKDVEGKEIEYNLEKQKFNSLYGMSVTNTIRDEVEYSDIFGWIERELTNQEIRNKLRDEKKKGFLSYSYGCWITSYGRRNIIENIVKLDDYVIYCDTDSIKLEQGYDKSIIEEYNNKVIEKIKNVSNELSIDMMRYAPKDNRGNKHTLGLFELETKGNRLYTYDEFITQGSKKYATKIDDKISITVAGVPKSGAKSLKSLEDFKDDFVFEYEDTKKNTILYIDEMESNIMEDYLGNTFIVNDKSGACLLPATYVLGKSEDYLELLNDASSKRAKYKE